MEWRIEILGRGREDLWPSAVAFARWQRQGPRLDRSQRLQCAVPPARAAPGPAAPRCSCCCGAFTGPMAAGAVSRAARRSPPLPVALGVAVAIKAPEDASS